MNKAKENEWVFVLLGRDESAPVAIRAWIEDRIQRGKNLRQDAQIIEARRCLTAMEIERETANHVCEYRPLSFDEERRCFVCQKLM